MSFRDHIVGCAVGVTLEALGVPHETITPEEILALTNGAGLTGLHPALKPPAFHSVTRIPLGGTSDDWQLWRAVARSLIARRGEFDAIDMGREHVLELNRCTDGWGSSTEDGARRIERALDFGGIERLYPEIPPRTPHPPIPGEDPNAKGCGNGVAMKVGPLAIASLRFESRDRWLWESCQKLGELTHPNPRAWIAAYALAWCIRECLHRAEIGERPFREGWAPDEFLHTLLNVMTCHEPVGGDRVEDRLRRLRQPGVLRSAEALREATGTSCYALESVPFVIGTFLRHPANVRAGVLETLNAGGDTDTNVGMYASLAAANEGYRAIPKKWLAQIPNSRQAFALGEALYNLHERH